MSHGIAAKSLIMGGKKKNGCAIIEHSALLIRK
jgi:hypothetical protein